MKHRDEHDEIIHEIKPEMEDLTDFLNQENIRMNVLLAHENPYRPGDTGPALHWSCQIINNENEWIVVYFSKGLGLRLWKEPPQGLAGLPLHVPKDKIGKRYDGPLPPFEDDKDRETFEYCSVAEPPNLKEVMLCLAVDMRNLEQAGTFEKWAQLMKMEDSPMLRQTFNILANQRRSLQQLFGEGEYHRFLYETDLK